MSPDSCHQGEKSEGDQASVVTGTSGGQSPGEPNLQVQKMVMHCPQIPIALDAFTIDAHQCLIIKECKCKKSHTVQVFFMHFDTDF